MGKGLMSDGMRRLQSERGRNARDAVRAGDRADLPRECAIVPIVPIAYTTRNDPSIGLAGYTRSRTPACSRTHCPELGGALGR